METIFERNGEGITKIKNGDGTTSTVTVPSDRSTLSSLGFLSDGDDCTVEPYYVINKKHRTKRKYLIRISALNFFVWERRIKEESEIPRLEERYYSMIKKLENFRLTEYKKVFDELRIVGKAHVIPVRHSKDDNMIWEYSIHNNDAYGFEWIERPKNLKNESIGNLIYEIERKFNILNRRLGKFQVAFEAACTNYIYNNSNTYENRDIKIIEVNGREYLFFPDREYPLRMLEFSKHYI